MAQPQTGSTLGEVIKEYARAQNPVTRSVLRDIIARRLDKMVDDYDKVAEKLDEVIKQLKEINARHKAEDAKAQQ